MSAPLTLSTKQARKLAIVSQGLHKNNAFGKGLKATQAAVNQLSYIQIDSISVIQRAHHHCLWTRVQGYHPTFLDTLIANKQIFEYWSHAAAYLPMQDYRFSLPKKHAIASGEKHWRDKQPAAEKRVLEKIRLDGPLQAKDFEQDKTRKSCGWWDWKPAKIALEQLFMEGELMVTERKGFQKVYDLTERVLPQGLDTRMPSTAEFSKYLVMRYLKANGLGTIEQFSYLRKGQKARVLDVCRQMLENNELTELSVDGRLYYALPNFEQVLQSRISPNNLRICSPFDNLVIQRKRLAELFDFNYQIECYVPPAKRQYGYFCLPILWRSQFAGRMDCKIDRKSKVLHIKALHIETPEVDTFIQALCPALSNFMQFNGGEKVELHKISSKLSTNKDLLAMINKALQ